MSDEGRPEKASARSIASQREPIRSTRRRGSVAAKSRAWRGWLVLWSGPAGLSLLHYGLTGRTDSLLWASLFAAGAVYSSLAVVTPIRVVRGVMMFWLAVLLVSSVFAPLALGWVADDGGDIAVVDVVRRGLFGLDGRGQWVFGVADDHQADEAISVSFEGRAPAAPADTGWLRSHDTYLTQTDESEALPFTSINAPSIQGAYLRKVFPVGTPVGGKTFRLTWEFRSRSDFETGACRGVVLHAGLSQVGRGGVHCEAVHPTSEWRSYEVVWSAHPAVEDTRVNVDLRELEGLSFDVRGVALYLHEHDGWRDLGPAIPDAAYVSVSYVADGGRQFQVGLIRLAHAPQPVEHHLTVILPQGAEHLVVRAHPGSHLDPECRCISMGKPKVWRSDGDLLVTVRPSDAATRRQRLFSPHPNLAGHSAAVIGVGLAATALTASGAVVPLAASLFVIAATGSRAALLGLAVASLVLLLSRERGAKTRRVSLTLLGLLAVFVVGLWSSGGLGRLLSLDEGTEVVRTVIWGTSWDAVRASPWSGLPPTERQDLLLASTAIPGEAVVGHAHNLWLEFGSLYGLAGLAAAGWLTLALAWRAWRWGRWAGVAVLVPVALGQAVDYTLFYAGVLLPTVLWLELLRRGGHERTSAGEIESSTRSRARVG